MGHKDKTYMIVLNVKVKAKSLSHVPVCDPMDCSLPGSSLHGILEARVLEWVAISFSRGSSRPRDSINSLKTRGIDKATIVLYNNTQSRKFM